ncbi:V-type ATP synthase subunit I [Kushneria phosphatilytica]|uniref:V-type ATP synthase subunit I n=1 Tax=Kushneria phosphatilytica TaxID=657387 RepID=A0A1S1NPM1_9GAMM|nr:hypothetical protein [Kushneria phosphatilytica]OHV10023.1 hypothetical protein BH688_10460 [Kushneria phosphatilytica]QEL11707.1 V-type ATP synthase subunit I [Kushneria phosphatilytica]
MSIVPMRRVTLIGLARHRQAILQRLQSLGVAHIEENDDTEREERREYVELMSALEYLLAGPHRRRHQMPVSPPEPGAVIEEVLANRRQREDLLDHLTLLRRHRQALAPWGDFRFTPLDAMGAYRLWFYLVPLGQQAAIDHIRLPWHIINRDHRHCYLVVIAREEPGVDQVPFERSHTGSESLSEIRRQEAAAQAELEELDTQRFLLTRWIRFLASRVAHTVNNAELGRAERASHVTDTLFILDGWVPARRLTTLQTLCDERDVALVDRAPIRGEEPPVLLDNPEWLAGGEEAVSFFQLPGYRSWDPSIMVFCSFSLFFAIILADAGYALICSALVLLWRRRWKRTRTGRRLGIMALAMSGASLIYGSLVGNYFGITPPADSLLGHLHLLDMDDFSAMMALSIAIGVVHLMLANLLAALAARPRWLALGHLGWVLLLGSSFMLWWQTGHDPAVSLTTSAWFYLLPCSAVLILLFSSAEPVDSWPHRLKHLFGGLTSLGELAQAFGNALSYMRLFALGLSSASLAITFNQLAVEVRDGMPGGGTLLFIVILLLGHVLNLALALMGGVIHGLRLNLIEFLRWGISGEGRPFRAFANKEESTWIR